MSLVRVYAILVEEYDDPAPYGSGKLINRECVHASRSEEEAKEVYDSHKEFWADKSRFSVVWHEEDVKEHLAREVA